MTDEEARTRVVVCLTEGCQNEAAVIVIPDDGTPVQCGPCGQWIIPPPSSDDV